MISRDEADRRIDGLKKPRVTREGIEAKIQGITYVYDGTLTICIITMRSGYRVIGHSACVDPENYDKGVGERLAYDNAFNKLWSLEGYLLAETLFPRASS